MTRQLIRAVDDKGLGVVVEFSHKGDRFTQTICLVDGERVVPLAASVEGTDREAWPPSPPLQQLSVEMQEDVPVALLVGMAGTSHWSLSVQAIAERRELFFDIACRVRETPLELGSRYRILVADATDASEGELRWHVGNRACVVRTISVSGATPARLQSGGDEFFVSAPVPSGSPPFTCRWQYSLSLEDL